MSLNRTTSVLKQLGDPTRLRLLHLLQQEELTVAELTRITRLAQSRVSTHLSRLREAGLVADRRDGVSSYYRCDEQSLPAELRELWNSTRAAVDDPLIEDDRDRLRETLAARHGEMSWADSVAGEMARHYSPGRSFETTSRALLNLLQLGRVIDIASGDGALAELLAPHAKRIDCVELSATVVAAGEERLKDRDNIAFHQADMHALPFKAKQFDQALLMHALTYTDQPETVLGECARVLRSGGVLVGATLKKHAHTAEVAPYNHVNQGYEPGVLANTIANAGFNVQTCEVSSRERRLPHFEVITFEAVKP